MTDAPRRGLGRDAALAAVLVLLLGAAVAVSERGHGAVDEHPGSSYSAAPEGAKAISLLLERLGWAVERRTEPLGDFGGARLAFVLAPEVTMDGANPTALRGWIERGGTLVYGAGDGEDARALRSALGFDVHLGSPYAKRARVSTSVAEAPARVLSTRPKTRVRATPPGELVAWVDGSPVVGMLPIGSGRVIVIGDAALASNRVLAEADNAVFLAWLADRYAGGRPVVFDEWSHGHGANAGVLRLGAAQARTAVILAALALLLYAAAVGRRLGPPSPEPVPSRPATVEQVRALARFYAKARARHAALERLCLTVPPTVRNDAELVAFARQASKT